MDTGGLALYVRVQACKHVDGMAMACRRSICVGETSYLHCQIAS